MPFLNDLERALSKARLDSYRKHGGSHHDTICLYIWNTAICESLYPSFQMLEVGLRNSIYCQVAKHSGQEWLTNEARFLFEDELAAIKVSKKALEQRTETTTEDCLIAEMSFGFWTSLLDSRYERMWPKIIADVFPGMPRTIRTRGEVSRTMNVVRRLRNAALHHHSIWHWKDLKHQHSQMQVAIGWISKSISEICNKIHPLSRYLCRGAATIQNSNRLNL